MGFVRHPLENPRVGWALIFAHACRVMAKRLRDVCNLSQNQIDTLRAAGTMAVMPEENKKPSLEESLEKLESLREQMLDSAAVNQRVYDAVEKELGRIAREFFPGMNTYWQAEQFRELQNEISFLSSLYWQKLSSLDYQAKQSPSP